MFLHHLKKDGRLKTKMYSSSSEILLKKLKEFMVSCFICSFLFLSKTTWKTPTVGTHLRSPFHFHRYNCLYECHVDTCVNVVIVISTLNLSVGLKCSLTKCTYVMFFGSIKINVPLWFILILFNRLIAVPTHMHTETNTWRDAFVLVQIASYRL